MFTKRSFKIALLGISLFALLTLVSHNLGVLAALVTPTPGASGAFTSPLSTPLILSASLFDSPLPPPVIESYAQVALQYIAKRDGVPPQRLARRPSAPTRVSPGGATVHSLHHL